MRRNVRSQSPEPRQPATDSSSESQISSEQQERLKYVKILIVALIVSAALRLAAEHEYLKSIDFPWLTVFTVAKSTVDHKLFLYNFPNIDEQRRRLRQVDSYSMMACRANGVLNGISPEDRMSWRLNEWTINSCGKNNFWSQSSNAFFSHVDFAQNAEALHDFLPEWVECTQSSSTCAELFAETAKGYAPEKHLKCDFKVDKLRKGNLDEKILVIESSRSGHWNLFHELVIEAGPKTWCILDILTKSLEKWEGSVKEVVVFEPHTYRDNVQFGFLASLLESLSSIVTRFSDEKKYKDYIFTELPSKADVTRIKVTGSSLGNSIIPSYLKYLPDLKPFTQLIDISSKVKDMAFKITNGTNPMPDQKQTRSKMHCMDCILIIQRDDYHRRMVGMNTGTFTEIVLDLLKYNLPIQIATLEGLSAVEQMQLFSNARIVIAMHGAALTNLIWMRPRHSAVVEVLVNHGWGVHFTSPDEVTLECVRPCTENYFKFDYFNLARLWSVQHAYIKSEFSSPLVFDEERTNAMSQTKYLLRGLFYVDSQMLAKKVAGLYNLLMRQEEISNNSTLKLRANKDVPVD